MIWGSNPPPIVLGGNMNFLGQPHLTVTTRIRKNGHYKNVFIGTFDENGLMEVSNPDHIIKMRLKYEAIEEKPNDENPICENLDCVQNRRICKKCGMEFDGQGALMSHMRKEHPKGETA